MIKITNKQLKFKISSRHRQKKNKDWIMLLLILGEIVSVQRILWIELIYLYSH